MKLSRVNQAQVAAIVHSGNDSRYLLEFLLYVDVLIQIINRGCLAVHEITVILPGVPEDPSHDDLIAAMEHVVKRKRTSLVNRGYTCSATETSFQAGRADLVVRKLGEQPLIAVEVGQVRADKLLECFRLGGLRELWVCPYQDVCRGRLRYYVFKPGPHFDLLGRYGSRRFERLREAVNLLD